MIYSIRFDLGESNFGRIRKLIAAHPFTFLAYMETNFSPNITREGEWYSELQHRLVVLVSLLTFVHRSIELEDPEPFRAANNLVSHAMNRIKKLAQDVIRRSHEEEARLIVEVLLPNLLEYTGVVRAAVETERWESLDNDAKLWYDESLVAGVGILS